MTPYAYSIPDYGRSEIFPTLELAVRSLIEGRQEAYAAVLYPPIVAHFPDLTETKPDLTPFMTVHEVDLAAIEAEVDRLREASRAAEERANAEWAVKHGTDRRRMSFSGCSTPYHELDRQICIDDKVGRARYTWKPEYLPASA